MTSKSLKISLISLFLGFFFDYALAQADYTTTVNKFPKHPRILLFEGEEVTIKARVTNGYLLFNVHQTIINEAERYLNVIPVKRELTGRRLLEISREALKRIFYLSYAYRITDKPEYLKRAELELVTISRFSDWNPTHFLDVAEMTMAAAIGYDWLYNNLSENSKFEIKEAILKKGLEPSLDLKNNEWLKAEHNWNQVCNAGMSFGAMAVYEDYPTLSQQIIERAIKTIVLPMKDYSPDGAYPEGYNYWAYGTTFNVMFISAIDKLFGYDFGLSKAQGFLNTASFMQNMIGASGIPFNFSDARAIGSMQPAMFWFANKLNDPSLLWTQKKYLDDKNSIALANNRFLPLSMLWIGDINTKDIVPPKSNMYVGKGKNPVALIRTSWIDSNAVFLALKGGSASVNHGHMDIGSFVMDANGERWAMDFGLQEYESLESKGIKLFDRTQDAQRWSVFRYTNMVHNTLTINNKHQIVKGFAPIVGYDTVSNFKNAVTDLSEIYKNQIAKAFRGVAIVDKSYVLVRDEIESLNIETNIRWTMLTPASVKVIGRKKAILTKNGKTLILRVEGRGNIKMQTWSTNPPNEYDAPNPNTELVGFTITIPPHAKAAFNVFLIPKKPKITKIRNVNSLENWNVN